MKHLFAILFLITSVSFGVTGNKVWRVPNGATLPGWGPVNLADGTNAITGALASKTNLPPVAPQVSASSGAFSTGSTSYVDVSNLSLTFTTVGRPVLLMLLPIAGGTESYYGVTPASAATYYGAISWVVDGSSIAEFDFGGTIFPASSGLARFPVGHVAMDSSSGAGSHTYKIQVKASTSATVFVNGVKLVAVEL